MWPWIVAMAQHSKCLMRKDKGLTANPQHFYKSGASDYS